MTRLLALLVGECNPYQEKERARFALYPYPERSAGGRLCRVILGLEPRAYLAAYHRANLCSGSWSIPAARRRAQELMQEFYAPDRELPIVLLGAKVAEAFGQRFEPFTHSSTGPFVLLPHPSGLSRLWNESGTFERARALLREAGALPAAAPAEGAPS